MSDRIHIVTAIYGDQHGPYLEALLGSLLELREAQPTALAAVHVLHAEVPAPRLETWQAAAGPDVVWAPIVGESVRALLEGEPDRARRVARKVWVWTEAVAPLAPGLRVVCLDADTLVLRPPAEAWAGVPGGFQLGYTHRAGRWPLNTGVLFLETSPRAIRELADWARATERWLTTPERTKQAIDAYGAPDQAGLVERLAVIQEAGGIRTHRLAADVWNQDRCPPDLATVGILHLKGCLPLLLGTRPYGAEHGDERTPEACAAAFARWHRARARFLSGGVA